MKVIIAKDREEVASFTSHFLGRRIKTHPAIVIGLATGATMVPVYRDMVRMHKEGRLDLSMITTFNLDEFVGLAHDDPSSFRHYMHEHLFDHVAVDPRRIHIPDGAAPDLVAETNSFEDAIGNAGGIDIQLLGIGRNGHIAFNEPGSSLSSRTRVKRLLRRTIYDHTAHFGSRDKVPEYVITMGIGTIMDAEFIILLATGAHKAAAIARAIEGPVTAQTPASVLQFHRHAFVVVDHEAAAELNGEYETVDEVLADPYEEYLFEGG